MAENNDRSNKENLLENFKPIIDPTMKNYKPGPGPVIDPLVTPEIKPGPAIGIKPGEGGGGSKPDADGESKPGGSQGEQSS